MERKEAIEILGLAHSSFTAEELAHAYRTQVRANHPDLHGRDKEDAMRRINLARDVLSQTTKRNFGIAGQETWSDIRGLRNPATVEPTPVAVESGMFARFVKRRNSGAV